MPVPVLSTRTGHELARVAVLVALGTVLVGVTACGSSTSGGGAPEDVAVTSTGDGTGPADDASVTSAAEPPADTAWQVQAVVGEDGERLEVPEGVSATLAFADGRAVGSGGCNRWSASYELDGTSLSLGTPAATMMACPGAAGAVESAFFAALPRVAAWDVSDGGLTLLDADGGPVLQLTEVMPTSFTGTTWVATGVNNGRGGVESVLEGSETTAVFAEDGQVTGSSGCNRYRGPYTLDGEAFAVGTLAGTRRACADPALMDQEAAYLAALERASTARVEGDTLELRDDDGALQVSFVAGT